MCVQKFVFLGLYAMHVAQYCCKQYINCAVAETV